MNVVGDGHCDHGTEAAPRLVRPSLLRSPLSGCESGQTDNFVYAIAAAPSASLYRNLFIGGLHSNHLCA